LVLNQDIDENMQNNCDFSISQYFHELKNEDLVTKDINNLSLSLDYNNCDFKGYNNNNNLFFGSDGYIEEEDDDQFTPTEEETLSQKPTDEIITTANHLKLILSNRRYENHKFKIELRIVSDKGEKFLVIKEDFMIEILKFLFDELNDAILELSDNCAEDRRKFFENNFSNYTKTIELYLKKKNEFFSCVLSNLFFKLSIKQEDFDNSINYYINIAIESEIVNKIRSAYEKVYQVGKKQM